MKWRIEHVLAERLAEETGYYKFPFGSRHTMAICYANTYEVAMSNLGLQIIYKEVNGRGDWQCERAFLPDKELAAQYNHDKAPLMTLENQRLADQARLAMGAISAEEVERKRLEAVEPGITHVTWGPDGSVLLDESLLDRD